MLTEWKQIGVTEDQTVDFALTDKRGRKIGAKVFRSVRIYTAIADQGRGYGYTRPEGTYYVACVQAARNGRLVSFRYYRRTGSLHSGAVSVNEKRYAKINA